MLSSNSKGSKGTLPCHFCHLASFMEATTLTSFLQLMACQCHLPIHVRKVGGNSLLSPVALGFLKKNSAIQFSKLELPLHDDYNGTFPWKPFLSLPSLYQVTLLHTHDTRYPIIHHAYQQNANHRVSCLGGGTCTVPGT